MHLMNLSRTHKLTISGLVMALYIVILYLTQSLSFGPYQIRIATTLYALSYWCPFLVVPLGLANFIANMLFGGLGILDMIGGCLAGMAAAAAIVQIKKLELNQWFILLPIIFIPGLFVPVWLSYLLKIPYTALAVSLCIGQAIPAVCGVLLVKSLKKYLPAAVR